MRIPTAKFFRLLAVAVPFIVSAYPSYALDYPTRPIRFIVSFAAGGPNDTIARLIGQYLSEQLGQTVGFVAPNNAINQTLYQNIPFDFVRDSTPIAGTMSLANVMEVNLAFPPKNVAEFI